MKEKKNASVFLRGGWKMLVCIALLAAVVLSGLFMDNIGRTARIDLTKDKLFTLSDTTVEFLSALEDPISIYSVYNGETDNRLTELLLCYTDASDKVNAHLITPDQTQYFTSVELSANSLIVTNGQYVDILEYSELYTMEYETEDYYQTLTNYALVAEDRINKAIAGVTADLPVAYLLSGHGEAAIEPGFVDIAAEAGCHTRYLYLTELDAVPQDCALIICNAPQIDITQKEADLLIDHIDNGGSFFLVTDAKYGAGEQLLRVTEHAGLTYTHGIILEGDTDYMFGSDYAYYLMPEYNAQSPLAPVGADDAQAEKVLIGLAHAIDIAQAEGYTAVPLLETSDSAYLKPNAYLDGMIGYVQGDPVGPFCVGATAQNEAGGKLFWLAGSQCLGDSIDEMVLGANYAAAQRALVWMHENTVDFSVPDVAPRSVLTPAVELSQPAVFIGACAALPVLLFVFGMIMCVKRHNRKVHTAEE